MTCQYASSGCNSPEGECLGICMHKEKEVKEYISMERAVAVVSALELRSEMRLHIDDLHAICNAAAEQARADLMKELLGKDVEPVAWKDTITTDDGEGKIEKELLVLGYSTIADIPDGTDLITTTQAAAMVLQEREACANVCDDLKSYDYCVDVRQAASAIRNRKD